MIKYLIFDKAAGGSTVFFEKWETIEEYKKHAVDFTKKTLKKWKKHRDLCSEEYIRELEEEIKDYDKYIKIYELKEIKEINNTEQLEKELEKTKRVSKAYEDIAMRLYKEKLELEKENKVLLNIIKNNKGSE